MATSAARVGLTPFQSNVKRCVDVLGAAIGLALTWWIILIAYVLASIETGHNGFFTQTRVGQDGRLFRLIKIRTMNVDPNFATTVTTARDPRVTQFGRFFRRWKVDELPQLINVLVGHMSFVGPRPDVPGFADMLADEDRIILTVRPGITGPATLKYRNEEELLCNVDDPEVFNKQIIFPDKVRINKEYVLRYRFRDDIVCVWKTLFG